MDKHWKVIRRNGSRLIIERDKVREEIRCPRRPYAKELFLMMRPGQIIDEDTVELLIEKRDSPILDSHVGD